MQEYMKLVDSYGKLGGKITDLERIRALMGALGDPHKKLKFVHIAGTNGKGSCAEMTAEALRAAGYTTGLFTSPYILRYNDRIRVNGEDISDAELNALSEIVDGAVKKLPHYEFSQFEITQAMAFLHFIKRGCDIVVLETGVGGLLDSTNVIPPPLVSVICSISLDHTAILGGTIEKIAAQKAGIIKKGSPCVTAPENPRQAMGVIGRRARLCNSQLVIPDMAELKVERCTPFGCKFSYRGEQYETHMGGYHQIKNALTVIEVINALRGEGYDIPEAALKSGLLAQVPARVQILSREPLIILDGGHNPEGVKALADALAALNCPKRAVIGMLSDKDSETAAEQIAQAAESFICVDGYCPRAREKGELAEILARHGAKAAPSPYSPEETVRREIAALKDGEALVICGSLFLAALFADGKIVSSALENR